MRRKLTITKKVLRSPAAAGQFYPDSKKELSSQLKSFFELPVSCENKGKILAAVSPHAGYAYSGAIASYAYRELKKDRKIETAAIIGPNHTGIGPDISIFPEGTWETPLGEVMVDEKLAKKIAGKPVMDAAGNMFTLDETAHEAEHSVEVQVPFLQYLFGEVKIVPICMMDQSFETSVALGKRIADVAGGETVVIASSDFSHYIPYEQAYGRDGKAIEAIKKLDEKLLFDYVSKYDISMCGPGCVAAAITYAKEKGAKEGRLLRYATSGDVVEDKKAVVGYAAFSLE